MNVAYNMDCMEYMRTLPDKFFDLAVVDPPYGIAKAFQATSRIAKYGQLRTVNDAKPTQAYFNELRRVSRNQIVWGYNHLSDMLPSTKEFIFWYKHQPVDTYADGELAYTSFEKTAKCFDYAYFGGCMQMMSVSIPRKSRSHYTPGFLQNTHGQGIKSSTRILAAEAAELQHMTQGSTLWAAKSTRNILTNKRRALLRTQLRCRCLEVV